MRKCVPDLTALDNITLNSLAELVERALVLQQEPSSTDTTTFASNSCGGAGEKLVVFERYRNSPESKLVRWGLELCAGILTTTQPDN